LSVRWSGIVRGFLEGSVACRSRVWLPRCRTIWFTDGREAAGLGIDELDNYSRIFASREYPPGRLLAYRSIGERLSLMLEGGRESTGI
jgi:hypothetical protein